MRLHSGAGGPRGSPRQEEIIPFLRYWLNLDSFSIIRLSALLLSLIIAAYLFSLKGKSASTILLAVAFCGASLFNAAALLELSGFLYWQPSRVKNLTMIVIEHHLGPSTVLAALMLFAYSFPRFRTEERTELRIALSVSVFVSLARLAFGLYDVVCLEFRRSDFRLTSAYFAVLFGTMALQFLLVVFLLFRKTVRLAGRRHRGPASRLARPEGKDARAARSLGLILLLPLVSVASYFLMTIGFLPPAAAVYCIWLGFLLFYFSFVVEYLNHTTEATTLQAKLVGLTLAIVLSILGLVGVFTGNATQADFRNENLALTGRSFSLLPNASGSYDVRETDFRFEPDKGRALALGYGEQKQVDLPFPFPFFSRSYSVIQVLHSPMIYLGKDITENGWGGYHPQPAVAPLLMDLDPSSGGGIFLKSGPRSVTVTWYRLAERGFSNQNTVQLTLHDDGSLLFCYAKVDSRAAYHADQLNNLVASTTGGISPNARTAVGYGPRLAGIHPGLADGPLHELTLATGLPFSGRGPGAVFESFEKDYSTYLHRRMAVLALVLLASTLFILFVSPLLFRAALISPLRALYKGMQTAERGDLEVVVPARSHDEIGFLARAFTRMLHSLRTAEASFSLLAENAEQCIIIFGSQGAVYANRRAIELAGFSGVDLAEIDRGRLLPRLREPASGGTGGQVRETHLVSRSGAEIMVDLTESGTLWRGKPADVVIFRDITERKKVEEEARQRHQRLMRTDKLTTLGVLAAGMAHEINNPNQSILSNASLLRRAVPAILSLLKERAGDETGYLVAGLEEEEFRRVLPQVAAGIEDCSARIDAIVKHLKAFSREDAELTMGSLDVNGVVRSAADMAAGYIQKATEHFVMELESGLPAVRGNAPRLEQVVINLLFNACQALRGRDGSITVATRCGGGPQVLVEVRDDGVGIPPENLARLREPFFTTKRATGGTGLGLYVAQTIVSEHRGSLRFTSRPGAGTVAVVSLPVETNP